MGRENTMETRRTWSREARDLRAPEIRGIYPIPRYAGLSLANLPATLLRRMGTEPPREILPPLDAARVPPGDAPRTSVVLLMDSLGWRQLEEFADQARTPLERSVAQWMEARGHPITTVFPSTTSSALLSLSTGTPPARHGIVGYTEYFPRWGAIYNTLTLSPVGASAGSVLWDPDTFAALWNPVPTIFQHLSPSVVLLPEELAGSGFSRIAYQGARRIPFRSLSDLEHLLTALLCQEPSQRPRLVWIYWDALDRVAHVRGPLPGVAGHEILHMALTLASVARNVPSETLGEVELFVTGDHGHLDLDPRAVRNADGDEPLFHLLARPPAGERRAVFLQAARGRLEELGAYLATSLPPDWLVLPREEVARADLLGPGPNHPELWERLGDFLVLPPPGASWVRQPPGTSRKESGPLLGAHGGLTPDELLVPLVVARGRELRELP